MAAEMDDVAPKGLAGRSGRAGSAPDLGDRERAPRQRDPERTRRAILEAATLEFVEHGFAGASVNEIAARAQVNKRMLYHYYGKKDDLYLAVLECMYREIRGAETQLRLANLPPRKAIETLVLFTWEYFLEHPEFLSLINTENMLQARHLRRSPYMRELNSPIIEMLTDVLRRGEAGGVFRAGVDPVQLYISIASLGFFYLSNRHTLSTIFERDLEDEDMLAGRGRHIVEVILAYLHSGAVAAAPAAREKGRRAAKS
jgi:TetR/AcrR family transcriptional regulator